MTPTFALAGLVAHEAAPAAGGSFLALVDHVVGVFGGGDEVTALVHGGGGVLLGTSADGPGGQGRDLWWSGGSGSCRSLKELLKCES